MTVGVKRILGVIVSLLIMTGCGLEYSPEKIRDTADFQVLLPEYIPNGFEYERESISEDEVFISFLKEDKAIDIHQEKFSTVTYQDSLMKYLETGENIEELNHEILKVGDFIGLLSKSAKRSGVYDYRFVPKDVQHNNDSLYNLQTNVTKEEFIKIVESLK